MSRLKHEEGATLILVLLVLVIFSISVSLLSFQINNMSAQFKKTETAIEAKHLADMGEEYYKAYVNKTVQDDLDSVDLVSLQNTHFMPSKEVMIDSEPDCFEVEIDSGSESKFEIKLLETSVDDDTFIIEYEIIGTVGTEEAVNNSEIKIEIW